MSRKHDWSKFDTCRICGCHRVWGAHVGYWRFVWEDGRAVEPNGNGAPPCAGFSKMIIDTCVTALMSTEKSSAAEKVTAVLGAFEDVTALLQSEGKS